jgi:hypothetical protein
MNTPNIADPTLNDLRPSATIDEALERLVAAHNRRAADLMAERDTARRQRDEIAACLREVEDGFVSGRFVATHLIHDPKDVADFARFIDRCHTALLRCAVRERLDERVAAERRGQESAL